MSSSTVHDWLVLAHANTISTLTLNQLLTVHPEPATLIAHANQLPLPAKSRAQLKNPNHRAIEQDLKWQSNSKRCHLLTQNSTQYPLQLKTLPDAPILLYAQGQPDCITQPQLAIVGSRQASPYGRKNALQFAFELARSGLVITSGMALGIDGSAHQGALNANRPTVAVLGSGLMKPYPKAHNKLAQDIVHNGVLLSELPIHTPPLPHHFPRRNRIISGLSLGTLVIEANHRSGSLITAKLALEQGREVFALPGSIHHPQTGGTHDLIQQGAKLTTGITDILEELPPLQPSPCPPYEQFNPPTLDQPRRNLLECVDFAATSVDDICEISGLALNEAILILLDLQLHGYINRVPGGYMRVV